MDIDFQDGRATERFEQSHADIREEIWLMAEADRWDGLAASVPPRPSRLGRWFQRPTTSPRLAA